MQKRTWRKTEAFHGAASSAARSYNVLSSRVDFGIGKLVDVQISGVLSVRGVAVVTGWNDRVEKFPEKLIAFVVTGNHTDSLDHRMT